MDAGRREFFLSAAALGVLARSGVSPAQQSAAGSEYVPSVQTRRLLSSFGLTYPIFQGPLGPGIGPALPIAVSNAGAMGGLSVWALPPEEARTRVEAVRAGTEKPFAVNYVLASEPRSLQMTLDAGAPIVQFSWGLPTKDQVASVRRAGAKLGIQISSREGAREALAIGVDYLVCQGIEAGGHVQGSWRLLDVLPKVLEEAKEIPVVAAGGMANGADIHKALSAGAAGVLLGTRFVATRECNAHQQYKEALVQADNSDTVLTVCFDGGWPHATHRVLRNGTFLRWEAAGSPPPGRRPGEGDVIAVRPNGTEVLRYAAALPTQAFKGTQLLDCALYAGEGVGAVRDIPSASELIYRLWRECETAAQSKRRNA